MVRIGRITWFEVMSANFAAPFAEWRSATVGSIESTSTTTVLRICERRVAVMVGRGRMGDLLGGDGGSLKGRDGVGGRKWSVGQGGEVGGSLADKRRMPEKRAAQAACPAGAHKSGAGIARGAEATEDERFTCSSHVRDKGYVQCPLLEVDRCVLRRLYAFLAVSASLCVPMEGKKW